MAWFLNPALSRFRQEVNARWPNRDKTSDGTIGDAAHQASSSDHNPDTDGSVDAWDMDVNGVDVWACINAALAHEAIQYVIYNRRITSRSMAGGLGTWHPYNGVNPHDKHVHFNTRAIFEHSVSPWFPAPKATEEDLTPEQDRMLKNLDALNTALLGDADEVKGVNGNKTYPLRLTQRVRAIEARAAVTVDATSVANALASNEAFMIGLADRIVARLPVPPSLEAIAAEVVNSLRSRLES